MKFVLVAIGSRGDVEPFIAIGELLTAQGNEVHIQLPEQFRQLIEDPKMNFHSLGPEMLELLYSPLGKQVMGGKGALWQKPRAVYQLGKINQKISKKMAKRQLELIHKVHPDKVLYSAKASYPMLWSIDHPGQALFITPIPYIQRTETSTHLLFKKDYGKFINKLSYDLAEWGLNVHLKRIAKALGVSFDLKRLKLALYENAVLYTISPQLFEAPYDWPEQRKVVGYQERNKVLHWQPPEELISFLNQHPKVLFVTFGSMTNPDPYGKTQLILKVLSQLRIPAIVNTSEGGLIKPKEFDQKQFYFINQIPYDWIFPKMYAVMHHGGAGTTHLSIKYGCVSLIIPHIVDQFLWNRIIHKKGLGPLGVKVSKLKEAKLRSLITDAWQNQSYKQKAEEVGAEMSNEHYENEILSILTN